jgi:hypothetical protein
MSSNLLCESTLGAPTEGGKNLVVMQVIPQNTLIGDRESAWVCPTGILFHIWLREQTGTFIITALFCIRLFPAGSSGTLPSLICTQTYSLHVGNRISLALIRSHFLMQIQTRETAWVT